jgi:hypothetical protein
MKRKSILPGLVLLLLSSMAQAGTRYEIKCPNQACRYTDHIGFGGGMRFEQVSGYCKRSKKIVTVTWERRGGRLPAISRMRDPVSGALREVFPCPDDGTPVVVIHNIGELKVCPRCGHGPIQQKAGMLYD